VRGLFTIAAIAALLLLAWPLLRRLMGRSGAVGGYVQRRSAEENTIELADWFGRTGLDDATERELPRYLRREFGEFLDDPKGLKANDLQYLGVLSDERGRAHFWRIPSRRSGATPSHAYIDIDERGTP
jgi:hypothetical protein